MQHQLPYLLNVFILSIALIPVFCQAASRLGLVDAPNGRKLHSGRVPVVGGIAMFVAVMVTMLMLGEFLLQHSAFFLAMALIVTVGVIDDLTDLGAATKALAQTACALIMVLWGNMVVVNLGPLFGGEAVSIPYTGMPFTVFCVVGLINALNMTDGADGLAGGISLSALFWFLAAALIAGMENTAFLLSLLIVAVGGFLVYNLRSPWRPRALVFMGDAGSMMLGFALAWFAVDLSQGSSPAIAPVAILWILALPAFDAFRLVVKRLVNRRSPFSADRDHLHHILQDAGYSVTQTVLILVSVSVALGGIGLTASIFQVPEYLMFYSFLVAAVLGSLIISRPWRRPSGLRATVPLIHDSPQT